jgi:hypothetical protein
MDITRKPISGPHIWLMSYWWCITAGHWDALWDAEIFNHRMVDLSSHVYRFSLLMDCFSKVKLSAGSSVVRQPVDTLSYQRQTHLALLSTYLQLMQKIPLWNVYHIVLSKPRKTNRSRSMLTLTCESWLPSQVLSHLASHVFPTMALSYLGKLKVLCPYSLARLTFDLQNTWSMGLPVKGSHNLWRCTLFHWGFFCQSRLGSHG